jgi:hypothetical protein
MRLSLLGQAFSCFWIFSCVWFSLSLVYVDDAMLLVDCLCVRTCVPPTVFNSCVSVCVPDTACILTLAWLCSSFVYA